VLRAPSTRKRKKEVQKLNLIPILDAVFIFIFFLLMSANFIKIYEIPSDIPIISDSEPPKSKKKPLALTLSIYNKKLVLRSGVPSRTIKSFGKVANGEYDLESLHSYLVNLKKNNKSEKTIVLEPIFDITYDEVVKIMDSVRTLRKIDDSIFIREKDGNDRRLKDLFSNIVFGNIQS
jgi:biopolymer transport protein ExbD